MGARRVEWDLGKQGQALKYKREALIDLNNSVFDMFMPYICEFFFNAQNALF